MKTKKFKMTDDGFYRLMGMIIYTALDDALTPVPEYHENMTKYQKEKREKIIYYKNNAIHFFLTSNLWKDTKLDFKFMVQKYKEKNNGKRIDEKVASGQLQYYED